MGNGKKYSVFLGIALGVLVCLNCVAFFHLFSTPALPLAKTLYGFVQADRSVLLVGDGYCVALLSDACDETSIVDAVSAHAASLDAVVLGVDSASGRATLDKLLKIRSVSALLVSPFMGQDYLANLQDAYPDMRIYKMRWQNDFVMGDMVLHTMGKGGFSLTHGTNRMLYSPACVSNGEYSLAILPHEAAGASAFSADTVLTGSSTPCDMSDTRMDTLCVVRNGSQLLFCSDGETPMLVYK